MIRIRVTRKGGGLNRKSRCHDRFQRQSNGRVGEFGSLAILEEPPLDTKLWTLRGTLAFLVDIRSALVLSSKHDFSVTRARQQVILVGFSVG
jgi:hypothetical protein